MSAQLDAFPMHQRLAARRRFVRIEVSRCCDGEHVALVVVTDGHRVLLVTPPGAAKAVQQFARAWIAQRPHLVEVAA